MMDCKRCGGSGKVVQHYYEPQDILLPIDGKPIQNDDCLPIKSRFVECPQCLGFSAVPLRPRCDFL